MPVQWGSQIAAYIANVGIPCDLLDIVPSELASEAYGDIMSRDSTVEPESNRGIRSGSDEEREIPFTFLYPRCSSTD